MTTENPGPLETCEHCLRIKASSRTIDNWEPFELVDCFAEYSPKEAAKCRQMLVVRLRARIRDLESRLNSQTFVINPEPHGVWEAGYEEGYDDRENLGRTDLIKARNPYPAPPEQEKAPGQ